MNQQGLVVVTGVTGFVGAEITRQLLAAGYRVRGTTRDPDKAREEGHITGLPGADERLEMVSADVLDRGVLESAVSDAEYLFHVASPYALDVEDPVRDLVEPALEGTINALEAAAASETMRRVVLTSSFVAMMGDPRRRVFTEADWNTEATIGRNPYSYSKTIAERAAWTFIEERRPRFDLVSINPPIVIGPTLVPRINQSHEWFVGLTNGSQPAILAYDFPAVDVRDVARAHIKALEVDEASGRYIVSAGNFTHRLVAEIAEEMGIADRYRLPRLGLDNLIGATITKTLLAFQPKGTRDYLRGTIGRTFVADSSKASDELGIDFIPVDQSIRDTWLDLDSWGLLG